MSRPIAVEKMRALHQTLWQHIITGYDPAASTHPTFMRDLYPWFGNDNELRARFVAILKTIPYDDDLKQLLNLTHQYANPLSSTSGSTYPLISLPYHKGIQASHHKLHIDAYFELDRWLDSLNLIIFSLHMNITKDAYAGFLTHPDHLILATRLGAFLRAQEKVVA